MKPVVPYTIQSGMSQSGSYILMLLEPTSERQIPIIIGAHEAQGILLAKETVRTRRPMTHELMVRMMEDYGLRLIMVTIDRVLDGVFYATLHISDGFNEKAIDSRTTDAITLALLTDAPIMVDDNVLEETGVAADNQPSPTPTLEALEAELRRCEEAEDYEQAAEIQKRIEEMKS